MKADSRSNIVKISANWITKFKCFGFCVSSPKAVEKYKKLISLPSAFKQ